jgi:hypothetical protein
MINQTFENVTPETLCAVLPLGVVVPEQDSYEVHVNISDFEGCSIEFSFTGFYKVSQAEAFSALDTLRAADPRY